MSKVLISSLVDQINSLLSRPVGSVSRKASPDEIQQREQLKQLRSHLEILTDDSQLGNLDAQHQSLVKRLQGMNSSTVEQSLKNTTKVLDDMTSDSRVNKSKKDKLEILPPLFGSQVVNNLFNAESDSLMETSTMTNGTPEPTSTFVNDRMIAALQQAIQQTLQQVVKESVQQSVQQVVSQTLAVERALMVGEISASVNKIVESQQRSQISQELIALNQQKQKLNAEILQLETDRANWMKQFQEFQTVQKESLDRSLQSVNSYLKDQVQDQIRDQISNTLQQSIAENVANISSQILVMAQPEPLQNNLVNLDVVTPFNRLSKETSQEIVSKIPPEQEFTNKVQEQTDRFLSHLDEMFSSTFRALENDIQDYQTSLEAKIGHMETLEQKGEELINALVDRISRQAEIPSTQISQSELANTLPELPPDIPARYLETVTEPVDENLINALLAGNEFGEAIADDIHEPINPPNYESESAEPESVKPESVIDVFILSSEVASPSQELAIADLHPEQISEQISEQQSSDQQPENKAKTDANNLNDNVVASDISPFYATEIESILGASSDTLFETPVQIDSQTDDQPVSFLGLDNFGETIIEDRVSSIAARELNPDFDLEAATQIVENFGWQRAETDEVYEIDLQPQASSIEDSNQGDQLIDDPQLLQWLEESSNRANPINVADISPDEELMSWLGNESLDMAKLPTQEKTQPIAIPNSISELANFDLPSTAAITFSGGNLVVTNENQEKENQDSIEENQIDELFYNPLSDRADDSEESLILLTNKNFDDSELPDWEDSLVNELASDLERLDNGIDKAPLIAANLDQFIRNTPYALTNWADEQSQTYPTIIEVSAQSSSSDLAPSNSLSNSLNDNSLDIPTIIENPDELFSDPFADSLVNVSESLHDSSSSSYTSEQSEIVIDAPDFQTSPFATESSEIPEIFDHPEALFDSNTENVADVNSGDQSPIDEMDDIFAEVIAENAAKYSMSTPFETNDELDDLFVRSPETVPSSSKATSNNLNIPNDIPYSTTSNSVISAENSPLLNLDTESELDTLLFGFDPLTEIEHVFNDTKDTPSKQSSLSDIQSDIQYDDLELDTVMQGLYQENYEGIDVNSDTIRELITPSEKTEIIEVMEELDTILQAFVPQKNADRMPDFSETTSFAAINEAMTILEDPQPKINQENDWSIALEQFESKATQPNSESNDSLANSELSADEFFASLEYGKLNAFADNLENVAEKTTNKSSQLESLLSPSLTPSGDAIANLDSFSNEFKNEFDEDEEDSLLNDFADAQTNEPNDEWDNLLNDLNSFNFLEPLPDDSRERLGLSSVAPITDTSENVLDIDSLVMESQSVALIPPPPEKEIYSLDDTWILGVDVGSTAIRASLLNSNTGRVYSLVLDGANEMPCKLVWTEDRSLDDPIAKDIRVITKRSQIAGLENGEVAIGQFKQFLKIGLPYRGVSAWQPIIQWSDRHQTSLRWLIAALKNLIEQIQTRSEHPKLPDLGLILLKLSGVVFGYPSNWSDTYVLNVREAILKSGLVSQAEQVMAVEQAIAPVLSLIHERKVGKDITFLIDAGAVTTSLCLVKGLDDANVSDRSKLHIRNLDYAGLSISQDIIVQLFYPHWQLITNQNRHLCQFDHLDLPEIAEAAAQQRILLQQYLLSSTAGQKMLELADRVKVEFGSDMGIDTWHEELMGQPLTVHRRELENLILQPFVQRLNREFNTLLSNAGILGEDVGQVFLLGNTIHIPLISRWLTQKLPHTNIAPLDTSVLANGLAVAPLYPKLQDVARQEYSDYFLLQEICRLNLTKSINSNQLLQQLQLRGINIKTCRDRILTILQGELPDGLFPWQEPEHVVVLEDPTLSGELFAGRLFELETDGTYQPNVTKFQQLRIYLQAIIGNMSQNLSEPLVFPEIVAVAK